MRSQSLRARQVTISDIVEAREYDEELSEVAEAVEVTEDQEIDEAFPEVNGNPGGDKQWFTRISPSYFYSEPSED